MTDTPDTSERTAARHDPVARTRRLGRELIVAVHAALRAMKLYPPEHQSVGRALDDVLARAAAVEDADGEVEIRAQGESLFVNGARLPLDLTTYASFGRVVETWRNAGVGALRATGDASPREWFAVLSLIAAAADPSRARPVDDPLADIQHRLARAGIRCFELTPPPDSDSTGDGDEALDAAKRTYAISVALTKDVINSVRMGRAPSARKIKRAVQLIVDEVLTEETSLIGLTALREYDEYTYTHSVNVCIFAVALGKRLGMSKLELYELGVAALMHDVGKSRVPVEIIQKTETLDDNDWRMIAAHPWMGVLTLFQMRGQHELPLRAMLAAHEHHMRCDLSGYPRPVRPRSLGIVSRIVAVADSYDAATSRRSYQTTPLPPAAVLKEMRDNPRRGLDPVVVKAFINLLGIYPTGSLVVLDTFELAVVRAASTLPEMLTRPHVLIVSDARGNLLDPPVAADLATRGPDGEFARTIIKAVDPDRYGVRVSDYLV